MANFILCCPGSSGLSLSIARYLFRTTNLPMIVTARGSESLNHTRQSILAPFRNELQTGKLKSDRLNIVRIDITNEKQIRNTAAEIPELLGSIGNRDKPVLRWAWVTPGVLFPEKRLEDLQMPNIKEMFNVNVIGHMLMMKHFAKFLPDQASARDDPNLLPQDPSLPKNAVWVNMSARVGSISANRLGGWYSYRASKAALNQITKTFDLHMQQRDMPAMCVSMHPGTVKTKLGDARFFRDQPNLMMPEEAAQKVVDVVRGLGEYARGRCWDYKGKEILP